ncbi:MAG: Crp/Fnr family transcriptional regulator [Porphyromonas sp.]|nr:Crp/Fnr family transcriptional regulator [Porphyromonas sp.]
MPKLDKEALMRMNPIYELLTEGQRELVTRTLVVEQLPRRSRIYNEGERVEYFYLLVEGSVKVFRQGIGGNDYVQLAMPGHFFNIRPYFTDGRHPFSAETYSETTLYKTPVEVIEKILHQNVQVCRYCIAALAQEVSKQEERSIGLMQKQMRGRLAETLIYLADLYGYEPDGYTLQIQLSRNDLAAISHMTPSNVSRTLSAFTSERILSLERKKIKIMNLADLERISDLG